MKQYHLTIAEAAEELKKEQDKRFTVLGSNGTMSIEYFAPIHIDDQQPHKQDEIYVIASGSSRFYRDGEVINCSKGDLIFVAAGMEHRFMNFYADLAKWVILYGPEGGGSSQ